MKKTALITGATSGIGEATARIFAANHIDLILCGRREDKLAQLKKELGGGHVEVHTLAFDVRDKEAVAKNLKNLLIEWRYIDILVNNAGNAHGLDPIDKGSLEDWDAMIDINLKGLLYVSNAVIPGMVHRKRGHIINIGSISGKEVYVNGNVYCASKFAVDALTTSMRMDLVHHNIRVTSINPGAVDTEFSKVRFKGDEERAKNVYNGFDPLTPHDVAEVILFAVTRPPHVNLADVLLLPTAQATTSLIHRNPDLDIDKWYAKMESWEVAARKRGETGDKISLDFKDAEVEVAAPVAEGTPEVQEAPAMSEEELKEKAREEKRRAREEREAAKRARREQGGSDKDENPPAE